MDYLMYGGWVSFTMGFIIGFMLGVLCLSLMYIGAVDNEKEIK